MPKQWRGDLCSLPHQPLMRPGLRKLGDNGIGHVMDVNRPPFEHGAPPDRIPGRRCAMLLLTVRSQVVKQAFKGLAECRRDLIGAPSRFVCRSA